MKRKLISGLKIFIILFSLSVNVSLLALSNSKTFFSSVVYASPSFSVQGALVEASGPNGDGFAVADSGGQYHVTEGLSTGNYNVTASAEGYLDAEIKNVAVAAGLETSNINFLLSVSGAISGKVTDAVSSSPLQGVMVTAVNAAGSFGGVVVTDQSGNYLINTNLATGTFNVTASYAKGYISKTVSGIAVTSGLETSGVNLALTRSGIITGTITDSVSSAPLQDILVSASTAGGTFGGTAVTNSSGKYRIDTNLGTGSYSVAALFPDGHVPKTVSGIAVTAGVQTVVDLALNRSGIISGRVTATPGGQPIIGASVTAHDSGFVYSGFANTNATGYYEISSGLGTGSYTVFASFGAGFGQVTGVNVVAGSETSNVDIQIVLAPSGTITGRVTNTTGSPIIDAEVTAEGAAGSGNAYTDSNGNYAISSGLGTGTYTVNASATGYTMQSISSVSVIANQVTSNVDFQLSTQPSGIISGIVQADMLPIPEFPQPISIYLLVAFSIAIATGKLYYTRARKAQTCNES